MKHDSFSYTAVRNSIFKNISPDSCMYIMLGASMVYFFDVVNY